MNDSLNCLEDVRLKGRQEEMTLSGLTAFFSSFFPDVFRARMACRAVSSSRMVMDEQQDSAAVCFVEREQIHSCVSLYECVGFPVFVRSMWPSGSSGSQKPVKRGGGTPE